MHLSYCNYYLVLSTAQSEVCTRKCLHANLSLLCYHSLVIMKLYCYLLLLYFLLLIYLQAVSRELVELFTRHLTIWIWTSAVHHPDSNWATGKLLFLLSVAQQGHLHFTYVCTNLIPSATSIKSDKWQRAHYTGGSYHQTRGRHPASHTNSLRDYSVAQLSLLCSAAFSPAAQYERVSMASKFLMEMCGRSSRCPQQSNSSDFTERPPVTYKHQHFLHVFL